MSWHVHDEFLGTFWSTIAGMETSLDRRISYWNEDPLSNLKAIFLDLLQVSSVGFVCMEHGRWFVDQNWQDLLSFVAKHVKGDQMFWDPGSQP